MNYELHRGDCLEILPTLAEGSIDLVLTDPPYGTTRNRWDAVIPFDAMWKELGRVTKPATAVCIFSQNPFSASLVMSNPEQFRYNWVWEKPQGTGHLNAKVYPLKSHEEINVFCQKPHFYNPQFESGTPYKCKSGAGSSNYGEQVSVVTENEGQRYPKTVLKFNTDKDKVHPTQKPVELLRYLIRTYTREGETVLDFTMGSGSTGVAALMENRKFVGIEKDAEYFEIAKRRIEQSQQQTSLFAAA